MVNHNIDQILRREQERIEEKFVKTGEGVIGFHAQIMDIYGRHVGVGNDEWGFLVGPQSGNEYLEIPVEAALRYAKNSLRRKETEEF